MTIWLAILIGFVFTILGIFLSYSNTLKNTNYYYIIGLILSLVTNYLWYYIAKTSTNTTDLYKYGMIWDFILIASWSLIPLIFFNVKLNTQNNIGLVLMLTGVILIKLGK